jgi:hypothetical protein
MADQGKTPGKSERAGEREARLATALRANLKRRKASKPAPAAPKSAK